MSQINSQTTQATVMATVPLHIEPLQGAQSLVGIKSILDRVLERIHGEFDVLLQHGPSLNDSDRKRNLLLHLHATRQQLMRLLALVQWSPKAKALTECVDQDKVLDQAAGHARLIHAAVDDMCAAHLERLGRFNPMSDVQTALEVLSTGNYRDLPSSIEKLRPEGPIPLSAKRVRLRRITHIIYSQLMKTQLPDRVQVVEVLDGYVILRAPGLYEAKVHRYSSYEAKMTLSPLLEVPDAPSIRGKLKTELPLKHVTDTDVAAQVGHPPASAADNNHDEEEDGVTSGPKPQRWLWVLISFELLPNSLRRKPLGNAQVTHLLENLNMRMSLAADAAAYEKLRRNSYRSATPAAVSVAEDAMDADERVDTAAPSSSAMAAGLSESHALSGHSSRSRSLASSAPATGTSSMMAGAAGCTGQFKANVESMRLHAADESTMPVLVAHSLLSDISMRLLLDAIRAAAEGLLAERWSGDHLEIQPAVTLMPGIRLMYWRQATPLTILLTPDSIPAVVASTVNLGNTQSRYSSQLLSSSLTGGGLHHLEIGIDQSGSPIVTHLPQLQHVNLKHGDKWSGALTSATMHEVQQMGAVSEASQSEPVVVQAPELSLNSAAVNVDELLLLASAHVACLELSILRAGIQACLQKGATASAPLFTLRIAALPLPWIRRQVGDMVRETLTEAAVKAGHSPAAADVGGGFEGAVSTHPHLVDFASASSRGPPPLHPHHFIVECPVLEVHVEDMLLMKVSKNLITGRILLHAGTAVSSDFHISSHQATFKMEEEINKLAADAYREASTLPPSSASSSASITPDSLAEVGAAKAVRVISLYLARIFLEQYRRVGLIRFISMARRLQLHSQGVGKAMMADQIKHFPWLNPSRSSLDWASVPILLPPSYPPLPARHTEPLNHHASTPTGEARGLYWLLSTEHPSGSFSTGTRPSYYLIILSCTLQGEPLQVLKVVSVPPAIYMTSPPGRLPHVSEIEGVKSEHTSFEDQDEDVRNRRGSVLCASELVLGSGDSLASLQELQMQPMSSSLIQHPTTLSGHDWTPVMTSPSPGLPSEPAAGSTIPLSALPLSYPHGQPEGDSSTFIKNGFEGEVKSVIAWCKSHMQWETMLCQFQSLGVRFVESMSGASPNTVVLESLLGDVPLPHVISRACLHSTEDEGAGSTLATSSLSIHFVHVRLDTHSISQQSSFSSVTSTSGSEAHGFIATISGRFLADSSSSSSLITRRGAVGEDQWRSLGSEQTVPCHAHSSGRTWQAELRGAMHCMCTTANMVLAGRDSCLSSSLPPLQLVYSFHHGHSVLDLLQDLASILRMQEMLSELERMGKVSRVLRVVNHGMETIPWSKDAPTLPRTQEDFMDSDVDGSVSLRRVHVAANGLDSFRDTIIKAEEVNVKLEESPCNMLSRKRGREDSWPHENGNGENHHPHHPVVSTEKVKPMLNDTSLEVNMSREKAFSKEPYPHTLFWMWPKNGSVELLHYGYFSAVLQYKPPDDIPTSEHTPLVSSASRALHLFFHWRPATQPKILVPFQEGEAGVSTSSASSCCAVSCCIRATFSANMEACNGLDQQMSALPEVVLSSYQDMADMGEFGLMMDALVITVSPMSQLVASAAKTTQSSSHSSSGYLPQPVLLQSHPPFQHRMLISLPCADSSSPSHSAYITVDLFCTATGQSWLKLCEANCLDNVEGQDYLLRAKREEAGLRAVRKVLAGYPQEYLTLGRARSYETDMSAPLTREWGISSTANRGLWVLVHTQRLQEVLQSVKEVISCLQG
ncbi:hypothetical protein CEUSTIGMA_g142.t1 [Chlamydomonas eustigma]|uniref:Mediator of RNA polymerase II transcription subunit 14 n=1 Tax=Chlamydomonas eustigma TaxID=1157962 RepID=A0A250WPR2_9CHLO|nr:hypothetical protein CEUSTIGMA_g142.t1 [Chlamydomonas eustigma]|eukprot:GAX72686.1 hypothetical protein CEUSTIGMA_g142.t1 [Chlamydomonas eustigma]